MGMDRMRVKLINEDKDAEDEVRVGAEAGVGAGADDGINNNSSNGYCDTRCLHMYLFNIKKEEDESAKLAAVESSEMHQVVDGAVMVMKKGQWMQSNYKAAHRQEFQLQGNIGSTPQTADVFCRFRPHGKNLLSAIKGILSVNYLDGKPLLK
ncbi:hypothetical protein Tco_0518050 [Tanacetum coccineum]